MLRIILISLFGLVAGAPLDQQKSTCEVCYSLVNELQDYLTTSQSKTSIEDYVKDLCVKLPSEEKDICLGFIRDYAGGFFTKLNSDLTPQQLCDEIPAICPSTEQEAEVDLDVHGPAECAICELAVPGIDAAVKEDANSAATGTALEKFCDGLPASLSATCKKIEQEIQAGLTQGFDPKSACRFVHLCPADTDDIIRDIQCEDCHQAIDAIGIMDTDRICKHLKSCDTSRKEEVLLQPSVEDDASCEICELLVTFLDQTLLDNKTAGVINSTLYAVCSAIPEPLNTTCFAFIPGLEKEIAAGIDPKKACTDTNFCPKGIPNNACDLCIETADRNKDGKLDEEVLDATCTKLCHNRERRSIKAQESISKPCPGNELECKSVACTACKLLLDGINGIIGANFTVETVDKTMTDICNRMAGESTQDACLRAVPKIAELLERGVSPEDACKIVGLCTQDDQVRSLRKKTALRNNKKKVFHAAASEAVTLNDDLECEMCKELGNVVNWLLKDNITETTVNSTLYTICSNLPATQLQDMCFSAGPKVLQAMKNGVNVTDVCVKVKICKTNAEEGNAKMSQRLRSVFQRPVQVNLRCDTCEFVVDELDKILADNGTDVQINATVYGICAKLQGAFMDLCLEAAPKLVETLEDGVNPQSSCMLIKLCDNNSASYVEEPQLQQVDIKCDACEFIISELNKVLADNGTDVKINSTVFSICTQIPGALQDLCFQTAPQVVNAIEKGADVNKTCVLVRLCDETSPGEEQIPAVLKANPIECEICKYVVKELDAALQKNDSFEKINNTVYEICDKLGEFENQCLEFAPNLVSAIAGGLDPEKACTAVKLCDSQVDPVDQVKSVQIKMESNLECDLCKYLIDEIDKRIVTNSTDQKINETVYKLCDGLDSSLKGACLLLAPSIVQELEKGADAEKVCEKIGLCQSSAEEQMNLVLEVEDTPFCDICKDVIKEIDDELKKNSTEQMINSTVYGLCNNLEGTLQTLCLGIAPQLVSVLENGADPDTACKAIKACDSTKDEPVRFNHPEKEHFDCEMCRKTLQYVYKNIEQDYPKVQGVLMQVCERLPVNYHPICVSMLEEDNGRVFKTILQSYTPVSMCEMAECVENHDISEISSLS